MSVLSTLGKMSYYWRIPTCGRLLASFWGFQIKKEFGFRETRKERSILPSTVENSVSRSTFWLAKRHPSNCKTCQNRWHRIQRKFIAQENIPNDTSFNEVDDKVRGQNLIQPASLFWRKSNQRNILAKESCNANRTLKKISRLVFSLCRVFSQEIQNQWELHETTRIRIPEDVSSISWISPSILEES